MFPLRLAEFLGRLSLSFDVGSDASPGTTVRSTVLAVELGRRAGASDGELRDTYWETLLGDFVDVGVELGLVKKKSTSVDLTLHDRPLASVLTHGEPLLLELGSSDIFERFLSAEPAPVAWVDEGSLEDVARTLAVFSDRRSGFFAGHSTGVAALAERVAAELGLSLREVRAVRLAALLHDLGRVSVPNEIWERSGALDWASLERVRLCPYYTGRWLAPMEALAEVAEVASATHERMDGSGYPNRRSARALSPAARVLAVSHAALAMSEDRAHRPALTAEEMARELVSEAAAGRFESRAVDAVLSSLGLPERTGRSKQHGLSGRELEVSRLLALGKSDREIGAILHISPRTVQVHVARILDKLGVRNRAGAAAWLVEHDGLH